MKILKVIIVFVVILGGIYFATQWNKIFQSDGGVEETSAIDVNVKSGEIRSAWASEDNWNEDLLRRQVNSLQREKKLKRYRSDDDYETVRNTIRSAGTDKLYTAIFREFHSPTCNHKLVELNYAGVKTLEESFHMENSESLQKVRRVKKVYDDITQFVRNPHAIVPRYDIASNSWTSFNTLRDGVIRTAANYRNSPIYQEDLCNIQRFIDGLKEAHVKSVVNGQERQFYDSLSSQICNHFRNLSESEITKKNCTRFGQALNKFSKETSNFSNMRKEFERFNDKYKENSNNN